MRDILADAACKLGIPLDETALDHFEAYAHELTETNKVMNLTAITEPEKIALLHFADCIAVLKAVDFKRKKVIDIGSGAGFPGLPMKLAQPDIDLTLLDSQGKRVDFLSGLCKKIGCGDVRCIKARAEEQAFQQDCRDSYDVAVSRAVARFDMLAELCMPYVRPGGVFLAMKADDSLDEIEAAKETIRLLSGKREPDAEYVIPGTDIKRRIIVIRKTAPTAKRFPRRFAKIKAEPLG